MAESHASRLGLGVAEVLEVSVVPVLVPLGREPLGGAWCAAAGAGMVSGMADHSMPWFDEVGGTAED